jgi:three-Cys-motif partner protein
MAKLGIKFHRHEQQSTGIVGFASDGRPNSYLQAVSPPGLGNKAKLIAKYLYHFILITKHGTYIDGFAGPQQPELPDTWAARLVLEIEPRWLRTFFLCDRDPKKAEALRALRDEASQGSKRVVEVFCKDFNEIVHRVLQSDRVGQRVATFWLLDQHTFECHWATVELLAKHKQRPKIEQFYFLPTGWLDRAFSALKDPAVAEQWWGYSDWTRLRGLPGHERADLFCRRFLDELSYTHAYAWPIYDREGGTRVMYHMIHATDHPEAPNLLARAYRKATGERESPEQLKLELELWQASLRT